MHPEDGHYDRSRVPESSWPDGSPVSNWSKAVAAFSLASREHRLEEASAVPRNANPFLAMAA
jgi:hypothetical protein